MKHTITITYEVESPAWDLAVEAVLRQPMVYVAKATVKTPGKQLTHVSLGILRYAAQQVADEPK